MLVRPQKNCLGKNLKRVSNHAEFQTVFKTFDIIAKKFDQEKFDTGTIENSLVSGEAKRA